jgi:hypothetical protein
MKSSAACKALTYARSCDAAICSFARFKAPLIFCARGEIGAGHPDDALWQEEIIAVRNVPVLAAAAAFVCLPLAAFGQDMTPDTTRYLSDPNFLPYAGQIYGTSAYTHTWTNGDTFNGTGDQTTSFRVNTDTLSQFLSYGLTDDLELNASIDYDPDSQRQVNYANGTQASLNRTGFADPSFGVVWRALEEGPSPVNVDLFGSFTPNMIDSKSASPDADGSIAQGGQSGTAGAALGYVTPQFSARGSFSANIYGDSSTVNIANGNTSQTQGYTDYLLSLETQTRINPLFSVNAGVSHTFASNQNVFNTTNGISHLGEPGDTTTLNAALNYNFVPNQFVVSATYAHNFLDNSQSVYVLPASDTSTRNRSANVLGLKLYYVMP